MALGCLLVLTSRHLLAGAIMCRSYGNTYERNVEPAEAVSRCDAQQWCGRMDTGNEQYHEVLYFCDGLKTPQLQCARDGCVDIYRLPERPTTWMVQLRHVPQGSENTTYFRLCCCRDDDWCTPDTDALPVQCSNAGGRLQALLGVTLLLAAVASLHL